LKLTTPSLLALDLDGTLLKQRIGVSEGHQRAVAAVRERGIEVVIVTGRPLITARAPWADLALDNELVCFNGVWVGHPDREPLCAAQLSGPEAAEICAAMTTYEGVICAYPDSATWLMDHYSERTADWEQSYQVPIGIEPRIRSNWDTPSLKIMFVAEPAEITRACAGLRERFAGRFHVVASEPDRIEVHHAHATKAWGLAQLCEQRGIARDAVWACGDAANDLEMVSWAGCGFAMGTRCSELRDRADLCLPSAQDDGLLALLPLLDAAS
jgi:Cof subfamily protein (haloacid dehalogenase superfamily)